LPLGNPVQKARKELLFMLQRRYANEPISIVERSRNVRSG
jgi:hypothetical protein